MTIFKKGHFVSVAGILLQWKVDCDGLSNDD